MPSYTEFVGLSLEQQRAILNTGLKQLKEKGVIPACFFAPAHTYDANTVKILCEMPEIRFISDGYALRPYQKAGMIFVPSICDGPFTMPVGLYTYVFHPSVMKEDNFNRLENFLAENHAKVTDTSTGLATVQSRQGALGWLLENGIYAARKLRNARAKSRMI